MKIRLTLLLACMLPTVGALSLQAAATPTPPAKAQHKSQEHVIKTGKHPHFSWVLLQADGSMTVGAGNSDEWRQLERSRHDGDYLWVKTRKARYEITEPAILAQVQAALQPMQQQGERMQKLGDEMHSHGDAMSRLHNRLRQEEDEQQLTAIETEMDQLSAEMDRLGDQMGDLGDVQADLGEEADDLVFDLVQASIAAGTAITLK
ncbi:hypothetical protein LZP73_17110 [Shewanella sp. AS16]|uniref:hypothetical protein n=1 Tax=Shewanella sp. AS16 TaxID=2907625 RepID=UPI001F1E3DA3|nr:hypothetical protein [Shewanella sp. AS16]MCE9687902.1 hypothetical protein [Shewanella sp. AS16]